MLIMPFLYFIICLTQEHSTLLSFKITTVLSDRYFLMILVDIKHFFYSKNYSYPKSITHIRLTIFVCIIHAY